MYIVLPSAGDLRLAKKWSVNLTVMMVFFLLRSSETRRVLKIGPQRREARKLPTSRASP